MRILNNESSVYIEGVTRYNF